MSAADAGKRALESVRTESLDETLKHLRLLHNIQAPAVYFSIPVLDNLLRVRQTQQNLEVIQPYSSPPSAAAALASVQSKDPLIKEILVEITSNNSSAGKTSLLYFITTLAILPSSFNGTELRGLNRAVVVLDADNRFDVARLSDVMTSYIKQRIEESIQNALPSDAEDQMEEAGLEHPKLSDDGLVSSLINSSLQHVHIFHPQSPAIVISTLKNLPNYLLTKASEHRSRHRALHSIILDSASAFYWQAKVDSDLRKVQSFSSDTLERPQSSPQEFYATLMSHLRLLSRKFECPAIATTWKTSSSSNPGEGPSLNPAFPAAPTLRIEVCRLPVRPFPPCISLDQAVSEKTMRSVIVEKHEFWAEVGSHGFGFVVSDHGVSIPKEE